MSASPLFPGSTLKSNLSRFMKMLASPGVLCVLFISAFADVGAAPYAVDPGRAASGGGASAGGSFKLSGVMGQPEAGSVMTGGRYAAAGGLLALPIAVQTSGGPRLTIARASATQVTISWSPATAGYVLQQNSSLDPASWTSAASAGQNPVTVSMSAASRYYRVVKP